MRTVTKNKKGGVVTTTVMGVGGLIVGVILILIIVSTMYDSDIIVDSDNRRFTNSTEKIVYISDSNYTDLGNGTLCDPTCTIIEIQNQTVLTGGTINSTNYTTNNGGCGITFTGTDTDLNATNWIINSTATFCGLEKQSVLDMQGNFTSGIDNISEKIPTILLIVAVVFLFGALILLVRNARAMGIGGGGSL